jgi:PBP1b-binding outer membrane lipoprotein LpoB
MYKIALLIIVAFAGITLNSCSKKVHPSKTATVIPSRNNTSPEPKKTEVVVTPAETKKIDSVETPKPVVKPKPKTEFPKVITVNDEAASKSVDGRLYYDVMGHRYWKNFKDGKYYLFDKSMYNNPDFNPSK